MNKSKQKTKLCECCNEAPATVKHREDRDRRYIMNLCEDCEGQQLEYESERQFIPSVMKLGEGSW